MKRALAAVFGLGCILLAGCVTPPQPDATTIQGTWSGQEIINGQPSKSYLFLDGTNLEFHAANNKEWYKATYTLKTDTTPGQLTATITACPQSEYVGKIANALYELIPGKEEQATLILTGNEPGNPAMPDSLQDPRSRQIVFTRD